MEGTINRHTYNGRVLTVYVPPQYGTISGKLPVVYVHDGDELFSPDVSDSLTVLERMTADGLVRPLLLVGIDPKERRDEYTPWPAPKLTAQFNDFAGEGPAYLAYLVEELMPFIAERYRTGSGPGHTGMIGASLGGLISMFAAYEHPGVFGRIGSISGSYWYERFVEYMKEKPIADGERRIYMYVGTAEGATKTNIQKTMVARTFEAHEVLLAGGFPPDRLKLHVEEGASHELNCFTDRFPEALQWMFSNG
ncbi:alpha/beta hydrolase-fold protein [Paenibacillus sp. GYB004]|uniref:alpha/beta hydrolase n=1 Tax=Paenibacillus sp. GYB004 TaxID=2994393 RepID=UPI002F96AAAC